jgi:hypothetical protein
MFGCPLDQMMVSGDAFRGIYHPQLAQTAIAFLIASLDI